MKINHLNMRFSQRQEAGQCLEKQCRKVLVQADHPCRVFLFDPRMSCFQKIWKIWYPKFDGVSSLSSMKKQPFMEGPASPFSDKQMNHHIPISRFMSWNLNRLYIVHYCTLLCTIVHYCTLYSVSKPYQKKGTARVSPSHSCSPWSGGQVVG